MFGFDFLFGAALWALPLAGIPILLHLLFRRKSPIVQFSTLRFIRSSMQRTAARKKVQRWLLLACRALLLALLIWAVAQPSHRPGTGWMGGGGSSLAAAIVVDTSHSMRLQDQQITLLQKADDAVQDLLRNELQNAQVAIFRSQPNPDTTPPRLEDAADFRGDHWAPLTPTPNPVPLVDRAAAAADLLKSSDASRKWLIVITDAQKSEFPRPLPTAPDCQTMFIDLHPPDVSVASVTRLLTDPRQPRLGLSAQAIVDVTGRIGDAREVTLSAAPADHPDQVKPFPPLPLARIQAGGTAELSSPLPYVDASWVLITAHITGDEAMPWAQSRTQLIHIPPKQPAAVIDIGRPNDVADRIVRLALDPSEGQQPAWPITVHPGPPHGDEALVAAILTDWPDEAQTAQLAAMADRGAAVVLFIQPGLEQTWASLSPARQTALAALLPSAPQSALPGTFHTIIAAPNDPDLTGIGPDGADAASRLIVTRLVPFSASDDTVTPILKAASDDPSAASTPVGLLWRRTVGHGMVYTWATLPNQTCGNLRVSELFPPSLVNAPLKPTADDHSLNVAIGRAIELSAASVPRGAEIDVTPPGRPPVKVDPSPNYVFTDTAQPGLYLWTKTVGAQTDPIAWTNVEIPASEARLEYQSTDAIAPAAMGVLTAHSLDELRSKVANSQEPEPRWSWAIALALLLLCLEALLGSLPKTWKLRLPRPTLAGARA